MLCRSLSQILRAFPLVAALFALGCGDATSAETVGTRMSEAGLVSADIHFAPSPRRGENTLVAALSCLSDGDSARLRAVDAWMVAHGHEAHAGSVEQTEAGFEARSLDLFMAGRWQLELQLVVVTPASGLEHEPSEVADVISFPVDVP